MKILLIDAECVLKDTRYPLKDAFENLGHRVDMFDWSYYFPRHTDASLSARIRSRLLERHYVQTLNRHLRAMVRKAPYDLVLIVMGKYIETQTVAFIRARNICVVNWNSDDVFNPNSSSPMVKESMPLYDLHFTPRPHLISEYTALGARKVVPLDWYFRPGLLRAPHSAMPTSYTYRSSFLGSWSRAREARVESVLEQDLHVFGWGWQKHCSGPLRAQPQRLHAPVSIEAMHQIFHTSAVNINILTVENRDVSNLRNYEIPAAMGFQLAERSPVVQALFEEDKEIVCFSSNEELQSKCAFYLQNESARVRIAQAGFARLLRSGYTLEARLQTLLGHVAGLLK